MELRIPISLKLVIVTVVLILSAVIPIAFLSSDEFSKAFGATQHEANAELANSKASDVDELMLSYVEKIRTATNLLLETFGDEAERRRALAQTFGRDLDLVNIDIYQMEVGRPKLYKRQTNESYLRQFGVDVRYLDRVRAERESTMPLLSIFANKSKVVIRNTTLPKGAPLFSIGVPFQDANGAVRHIAIGDFRLDRIQKAFAFRGARSLFVVDDVGVVIAHKDDTLAIEGRNLKEVPIVQDALSRRELKAKGQRPRYFDSELGQWMVGAYSKTAFGLAVIAEVPEATIREPAQLVKHKAFTMAGYVLSAALFIVVIFSMTLTNPIERLHEVTQHVAKGNFNVFAPATSSDEVGELASSFNRMVAGLRERDKVKNLLTKFHGSTVTEDLLKNDVGLGGKRKNVCVFFSDIRGFTQFSEGHTPEEVVEMLNEYFQIMVSIVTKNHGVVDKFVGDAIMAVWGAPNTTDDDCYHAVKACLEMRVALAELNQKRLSRGQTPIRVGMGLHSGPAISGTIGSTERMEYTVIGDTVNMAARIEAATKAFGVDILVSDGVAGVINGRFALEVAGSAEVKGKSDAIKMYKIRGTIVNGVPVPVVTPYSDYTPEDAEKVHVA